ncbi:ATP synthase F0 subunit C [Candidatus Sumerlaeota bacterium]|nr:ATP synthase F0 subunit C [Candidatus Sumerlaeota bacterium]
MENFQWVFALMAIGYPLGLGIAALGSGLGLGKAVSSALEAAGRQPEAAGKLQTMMIIGAAFIEALTIYALISPFLAKATFMDVIIKAAEKIQ